jgi:hypothetical protein
VSFFIYSTVVHDCERLATRGFGMIGVFLEDLLKLIEEKIKVVF